MPQPSSDMHLIERYNRSRDASAFMELVQRYQDFVFGVCYRVLRNGADAEDAAQEAFLKLAQKAGDVRAPLSGWLHHVATCAAMDLRRRRGSDERRQQNLPSTNALSDVQALLEDVDEALSQLPPEQRALLVEHFLKQRTQAELAAEMGVSAPTLSRRVDDAVQSLRDRLKKGGVLSAGVLLACLRDPVQRVAPQTLRSGLAKIALSGVGKAAAGGGSLIAACALIGAIVVAAGSAALHFVPAPKIAPAVTRPAPMAPAATRTVVVTSRLDEAPTGERTSLFSRFELDARTVLSKARVECEQHKHALIGVDHILLGIAQVPDSRGANALLEQGATLDKLRESRERLHPDGDVAGQRNQIPFDEPSVTALKAALAAVGNDKDYVDTGHVLLGLIVDKDSLAAKVLVDCGVDFQKLRESLTAVRAPDGEKAFSLASEEAHSRHHAYIGTDLLIVGIARIENGRGARALIEQGITVEKLRAACARIVPDGTGPMPEGQLEFTDRTKKALGLAIDAAGGLANVDTGHLLLALLADTDGVALRALTACGADLKKLRDRLLSQPGPSSGPAAGDF